MLISHSKKFIFIHNYKVAGTSITNALKPYADYSYHNTSKFKKLLIKIGLYPKVFSKDYPDHIAMEDLSNSISGKIVKNYFKFGFVRNPWDWQVSLYLYALKLKSHHQHELIISMKDFDEYISWRVNGNFHLQKEFFYDKKGNCLVDFIGKYENLNMDFERICKEKIDVSIELPYLNSSKKPGEKFIDYYSQKSIDMIYETFKRDIDTFGYSKPIIKKQS